MDNNLQNRLYCTVAQLDCRDLIYQKQDFIYSCWPRVRNELGQILNYQRSKSKVFLLHPLREYGLEWPLVTFLGLVILSCGENTRWCPVTTTTGSPKFRPGCEFVLVLMTLIRHWSYRLFNLTKGVTQKLFSRWSFPTKYIRM